MLGNYITYLDRISKFCEIKNLHPNLPCNTVYHFIIYKSGTNPGNRSIDSDTESMISSVSGYELGGKKKTR